MITRFLNLRGWGWLMLALIVAGCATPPPPDYTNFRAHRPRSIPGLAADQPEHGGGSHYGYLSTVTFPLAEMGYYVFPVAVVDQFLKENGMPTAGEMHQIPLNKVHEIIGADAVLPYHAGLQYGSKYQVLNSKTEVNVKGNSWIPGPGSPCGRAWEWPSRVPVALAISSPISLPPLSRKP